MAGEKLLAEWFWTDRWTGSSGFLLPMEARGVYREMLTQAWHRGARLPNDHEQIQRAIAATDAEWERAWPKVKRYWRKEGEYLVNDTQVEIYREAMNMRRVRAEAGRAGGLRAQANRQANHQAKPEANDQATLPKTPQNPQAKLNPPSLSLSLSLSPDQSLSQSQKTDVLPSLLSNQETGGPSENGPRPKRSRSAPAARASRRAPRDFLLTQERKQVGFRCGLVIHEVEKEFTMFKNHEFANGKIDWDAVLENWFIRAAKEKHGGHPQFPVRRGS